MKAALPILLLLLFFLKVRSDLQADSWGKNNFGRLKDSESVVFNAVPEIVYGIGFSSPYVDTVSSKKFYRTKVIVD